MRNPRHRKRPLRNYSSRWADARQPKKRISLNVSTPPSFRYSVSSYYRSYFCITSYASWRKEQGMDEKCPTVRRASPALEAATTLSMDGLHATHTSPQCVDQTVSKKKQPHSTHRPPQTKANGRCFVRYFTTRQVLVTPASSPCNTSHIVQLLTQAIK